MGHWIVVWRACRCGSCSKVIPKDTSALRLNTGGLIRCEACAPEYDAPQLPPVSMTRHIREWATRQQARLDEKAGRVKDAR